MNIQNLNAFIRVCETKNVTKAAKELFISQSALTKQIQALEEELGLPLFERKNKRLELNEAGEFVLEQAKILVSHVRHFESNIIAFKQGMLGLFKLGILNDIDMDLVMGILKSFAEVYPEIEVRLYSLNQQEMEAKIKNREIDGMFGFETDTLASIFLKDYSIKAIVSTQNPLSRKQRIEESQLDQVVFDYRMPMSNPPLKDALLKTALDQGEMIVHSFVKDSAFSKYVKAVDLIGHPSSRLYFSYSPENKSPILARFIEKIQKRDC